MDFSLNSSVVLAAIVGLWLIWVAPYLLRRGQPSPVSAIPGADLAGTAFAGTASANTNFQRSVLNMTISEGSTAGSGSGASANASSPTDSQPKSSAPDFRIRWGRMAIALGGVAGFAAALVTFVLAVVGLVPAAVPVIALLLGIASIVVLRTLAVRGRRRRPVAVQPVVEQPPATEARPPAVHRPTSLFDAEEAGDTRKTRNDDDTPVAEAAIQFTAAELRAAALAVAAEAGDPSVGSGTPWRPVEVPKPTYVEAPKAERQEPAPLDLPEAPKPSVRTPLKNGAVPPKVEATSAPRLNLDEVLQRRRA